MLADDGLEFVLQVDDVHVHLLRPIGGKHVDYVHNFIDLVLNNVV